MDTYPQYAHCGSGSSIYLIACPYPENSATDPDSLIPDPDLAFRLNTNPDQDPGF